MHSSYTYCAIYFYIIADSWLKIQLYCKFMDVYKINVYKTGYNHLSHYFLYGNSSPSEDISPLFLRQAGFSPARL